GLARRDAARAGRRRARHRRRARPARVRADVDRGEGGAGPPRARAARAGAGAPVRGRGSVRGARRAARGARLRGAPPLHVSAATWAGSALAQYILRTLGDGMEMAHGIEGRVPFLDHRVAEVAFAIEPRVLAGDGLDKPVLRRAVEGLVPAAVAARPKHPFLAPPL